MKQIKKEKKKELLFKVIVRVSSLSKKNDLNYLKIKADGLFLLSLGRELVVVNVHSLFTFY